MHETLDEVSDILNKYWPNYWRFNPIQFDIKNRYFTENLHRAAFAHISASVVLIILVLYLFTMTSFFTLTSKVITDLHFGLA